MNMTFVFRNPFSGKPSRIANAMIAGAVVLAIILTLLLAQFILQTLDTAFSIPAAGRISASSADLIPPELVERVIHVRAQKLTPTTIDSAARNPFMVGAVPNAPVVPAALLPESTPELPGPPPAPME